MPVLNKFLEFLKANWKTVTCVAAVLLAFAGGRYSNPAKVTEVERVVYKDRIVEKIVEKRVEVEAKTKVVYRTKVITQEGETRIVEVEKEDTHKDTNVAIDTNKDTTKEGTAEKTKVTEYAKPQWKIGALVGYDFSPVPGLDIAHGLTLGVTVERRLIGPVWIGAWALHTGAVGGSLSVEF